MTIRPVFVAVPGVARRPGRALELGLELGGRRPLDLGADLGGRGPAARGLLQRRRTYGAWASRKTMIDPPEVFVFGP